MGAGGTGASQPTCPSGSGAADGLAGTGQAAVVVCIALLQPLPQPLPSPSRRTLTPHRPSVVRGSRQQGWELCSATSSSTTQSTSDCARRRSGEGRDGCAHCRAPGSACSGLAPMSCCRPCALRAGAGRGRRAAVVKEAGKGGWRRQWRRRQQAAAARAARGAVERCEHDAERDAGCAGRPSGGC